jgi:hypothetical protein
MIPDAAAGWRDFSVTKVSELTNQDGIVRFGTGSVVTILSSARG